MSLFSFLFCYLCRYKRGTIWVNSRYTTGGPFLSIRARAPFPPPPPQIPLVRSSVPDCAISSLFKHYYQRMPMTCLCSLSGLNWTTNEIVIPSNIPCSSPFEINVKLCHQKLSCIQPITDRDNRHRVVKLSKFRLLVVN